MNEIITVTQFNEVINMQVSSLGTFAVLGEITEKHITRNSGLIITLKDSEENAVLKISGFAPRVRGVNSVDVGMKVVAVGVPQLYSPFGAFSLQVVSLTPYGEGSLKVAFEKLKQLLESKGYFAIERKRKLPDLITRIGLITADKSAAQTDFLKILDENNIGLDIKFVPVSVQGKNAPDEIVHAIKTLERDETLDCIVLTRGGGSLEDLQAFNDEEVATAVFASSIPVLSAVGHERDTSISDLVADVVASTPSQAAYYLADINMAFLDSLRDKLTSAGSVLHREISRFDYRDKLVLMRRRIEREISELDYSRELKLLKSRLEQEIGSLGVKIDGLRKLLDSYNPDLVIRRGYALVRKENEVVTSVRDVNIGDEINTKLADGNLISKVSKVVQPKL